jgi:hypothetical protein
VAGRETGGRAGRRRRRGVQRVLAAPPGLGIWSPPPPPGVARG